MAPVGEAYLSLIRVFPLRPIRSEEDLDRAISVLNVLIDRRDLSSDEEDDKWVLADLIERFETEHYPEPFVPARDMLAFLLEQRDLTAADLGSCAAIPESDVTAILVGERPARPAELRAIAAGLRIDETGFSELNPATRPGLER